MGRFGKKPKWNKEKETGTVLAGPGPPEVELLMLSSGTAAILENQASTYHIYHKGEFHHRLTPERDAYKDKVWPSWAETKRYLKEKREAKRQEKLRPPSEKLDLETEAPGFFLHKPRICLSHPP